MFSLTGKTALITGASSGLGSHFAGVLGRAGACVVLGARRKSLLDDLTGRLRADGISAFSVALDVTDARSIVAAFDEFTASTGPIDILVNNAGVSISAPILDQPEQEWDKILDTNLKGCYLVATEAARRMRDAARQGSIVNIASIAGIRPAGQVAAYGVSKAALIQLTKSMALELARHGIRVNALAPGYVLTDLNRAFFDSDAGKALIKRIPQRKLGEPRDLDGALLLLASDASRYMTGAVVTIDGGHLVSSL